MAKFERFIIYPLLIISLCYGFIGGSSSQAEKTVAYFDRIEANEIVLSDEKFETITETLISPGEVTTSRKFSGIKTEARLSAVELIEGSLILRSVNYETQHYQGLQLGAGIIYDDGSLTSSSISIYNKQEMPSKEKVLEQFGDFFSEEGIHRTRERFWGANTLVSIGGFAGGTINTYNQDGTLGATLRTGVEGGIIGTYNKHGDPRVLVSYTDEKNIGHGGIWVFDRYGEFPAYYGHRR